MANHVKNLNLDIFISELEALVNQIIKSTILYKSTENRFNYIANLNGWDNSYGKYYPNLHLENHELDIQIVSHPDWKEVILKEKKSNNFGVYYELIVMSFNISNKDDFDLIFNEILNQWNEKLGKDPIRYSYQFISHKLHNYYWHFGKHIIGIQQVNNLSPNGKLYLTIFIDEIENFTKEKYKEIYSLSFLNNFIDNITQMSIIIRKLIDQKLNLKLLHEHFNNSTCIYNKTSKTLELVFKNKGVFLDNIHFHNWSNNSTSFIRGVLFSSSEYEQDGLDQIIKIIEFQLSKEFGNSIIKKKRHILYSKSRISQFIYWKFHDHLIGLQESQFEGEYESTLNIVVSKFNKDLVSSLPIEN